MDKDVSSPLNLRAYQEAAVEQAVLGFESNSRICIEIAPRSGRENIASAVLNRLKGARHCLFLTDHLSSLQSITRTLRQLFPERHIDRFDGEALLSSKITIGQTIYVDTFQHLLNNIDHIEYADTVIFLDDIGESSQSKKILERLERVESRQLLIAGQVRLKDIKHFGEPVYRLDYAGAIKEEVLNVVDFRAHNSIAETREGSSLNRETFSEEMVEQSLRTFLENRLSKKDKKPLLSAVRFLISIPLHRSLKQNSKALKPLKSTLHEKMLRNGCQAFIKVVLHILPSLPICTLSYKGRISAM